MSKAEHVRNYRLEIPIAAEAQPLTAFIYDTLHYHQLGLKPVPAPGNKVLVPVIHSIDIDCFFAGVCNIPSIGLEAGCNTQHLFLSENIPYGGSGFWPIGEARTPQKTLWEESDTIGWIDSTDVPQAIPSIKRNWFATDLSLTITGDTYFVYNAIQHHLADSPTDPAGYVKPYGHVVVNMQFTWKEMSMREFTAEVLSKNLRKP